MKNYFIVGASSGIGKSLAGILADGGANVYGTYCAHPIPSTAEISYSFFNVQDDHLNFDFLPDRLDGLVYCPGQITLLPFTRIKAADFVESFNLQVTGALKVLQGVLPRLMASGMASVVMFSTVAVQSGFKFHVQVSAPKGAVEGMTRALAAEFAPTIRFNAIAPSIIKTPLSAKLLNTDEKVNANAQRHPLKSVGDPNDIAAMAEFLLSERAKFITGQVITIDGGISTLKI